MQLITIKRFKSGSSVFRPGERIMVVDAQALIKNRLARILTKTETMAVFTEYVREAKKVFNVEGGQA